jgi:polyisoprenoid-binding protein YceI
MAATATRQVANREFPLAGTWQVDPAHTSVGFTTKHMMITKVRGHFDKFDVKLEVGEAPEESSVEASIDVASVTTGIQQRDDHLRSPDFFDVEKYPVMAFKGTSFKPGDDDDEWQLSGDLTIKETTRPVTLKVEFGGAAVDPWGALRSAFTASATINREDWGLTWNQALEAGGWLVGKEIKIEIEVEASKA